MMRSNAVRSTQRSLITGKARARHGSMWISAPSAKLRMCSWQGAIFGRGPCGCPLTTSPQVPQIPSLQSLSKAIGILPSFSNLLFNSSSISRIEASGETETLNCSKSPIASVDSCRQIFKVKFMLVLVIIYNSLLLIQQTQIQDFLYEDSICQLFRIPKQLHKQNLYHF